MRLAVPAAVIVVLVGTAAVVVAPAGHAVVLCSASSATAALQHAGGGNARNAVAAAQRELGQLRSDDEVRVIHRTVVIHRASRVNYALSVLLSTNLYVVTLAESHPPSIRRPQSLRSQPPSQLHHSCPLTSYARHRRAVSPRRLRSRRGDVRAPHRLDCGQGCASCEGQGCISTVYTQSSQGMA